MAYTGHASSSTAKLTNDSPTAVAPAERNDYDPADFVAQPGAAARANGYPRNDGRPTSLAAPRNR